MKKEEVELMEKNIKVTYGLIIILFVFAVFVLVGQQKLSGTGYAVYDNGITGNAVGVGYDRCFDTDGGINPDAKGETTGQYDNSAGWTTVTDYCINNDLREYYCGSDNFVKHTLFTCSTGETCIKGTCAKCAAKTCAADYAGKCGTFTECGISLVCSCSTSEKCYDGNCYKLCSDSDKGLTYNVKGTVNYMGKDYEDYCSSSRQLMERFCSGEVIRESAYICKDGCANGKCS